MALLATPADPAHCLNPDHCYRRDLRDLQIELVKFQRHLIRRGERILVLLEGRDAAGKDGIIKRIVEHLSPRDTRVVALSAPSTVNRALLLKAFLPENWVDPARKS